jgi:predicted metal-dependent hydrolase
MRTADAPRQLALFDDPPAIFRHPRAQHEIRLGDVHVGYALRRARRKTIGFIVADDGLTVSAPRWVGVGAVEDALRDKAAWIVRKLREQRERAERRQAARIDWRDGATLPFLGRPVALAIDPAATGALLDPERRLLRLGLPRGAAPAQIRDAVHGWLQRQARRVFDERCRHFAPRLGVAPPRLALSSAATRWGSASAAGTIRLHWRLIHFALPTIDYVVAHELAHLREMNHGPAFWDLVRSVLPDYERARAALNDELLPAPD